MAYEAEALDVAEKDANRIASIGNPQTGEHTLTRGWKPKSEMRKATVEEYLRSILTVTNPMCDAGKATFIGTYDVVSSGWDVNYQGYVQVLRLRAPWDSGTGDADAGEKVSEDLYEKQHQRDYFDQTTVPSVTLYATGVLKMLSVAIDKFKKWRVSLKTVTSKQVISVYTFQSRVDGGSETHCIVRNQQGNAPSFTAGDVIAAGLPVLASGYVYDLAGSPSRNPDNTWNWYIIHRQDDLALTSGSKNVYRFRDVWRTATTSDLDNGGYTVGEKRWQKALVTETTSYTVYPTAAAAWAANGGMPRKIGEGLWLVVGSTTYQHIWTWDTLKA